jgi:hypothetical protein
VFASPEAATQQRWRKVLKENLKDKICLLVFDEAHCQIGAQLTWIYVVITMDMTTLRVNPVRRSVALLVHQKVHLCTQIKIF